MISVIIVNGFTATGVFICQGENISCIVLGTGQYLSYLPQGSLEVCVHILNFLASNEKCEKAKKLIELALSVKVLLGAVKVWQITGICQNLPKFSPAKVLRYMVYH